MLLQYIVVRTLLFRLKFHSRCTVAAKAQISNLELRAFLRVLSRFMFDVVCTFQLLFINSRSVLLL